MAINLSEGAEALEPNTNDLIRATWAKASAAHVDTARLFYGKLFKIAPETRVLFTKDMRQQGRKLIATLGFIIDHLTDTEALVPAAQELAIRHVGYNVEARHYAAVSEALIWTLNQLLGAEFTDEAEQAWIDVLSVLENVMIEAAYTNHA